MPPKQQRGRVRIMGGNLRGRLLQVPPKARPTPARARETVFNWLAPVVEEAQCLDLFAGAGALGLEALSRGAAHCVFVESEHSAARMLRRVVEEWQVAARVEPADAVGWLEKSGPRQRMNIVFMDPPFGSGLAARCCKLLVRNGWLANHCRLYLEAGKREPAPELPSELKLMREKVVGDVRMMLAGRTPGPVSY
ncbi:MAG: 16S rRNA (guanine(966)-N(2))-methyltransferase RsmD [Gammaproteobacteria bacterium]|nr:16S rRNA (guanine(966)-N(2))-methyltransferase RsmD [Gammaproteobacteria bacterium]MCY4256171.1 16S rRNA (guanine(966)-N(2))-methyltransferase RsmD [Gammaproteobacteria bacterium]